MAEHTQKILHNKKDEIRCTKCEKLVAKSLVHGNFEIKCTRCGTLNTMFGSMTRQVAITDADSKILYINKAAETASGYLIHEMIGKKPSDLWEGQLPTKFYDDLWKTIKKEKRVVRVYLVNKRKSGELYDFDVTVSPVLDIAGDVIFYVGIENAKN